MPESEDYRITRQLGSGLAGPTFFAEGPHGPVAIRQFRGIAAPGTAAWMQERQYFLNSARAAASLAQARIVQVLDVIDEEDEAYTVSEYVNNPTLDSVLAAENFSPEQANHILRRMASTLDYAHQRGLTHGDLKPSNVFIQPDRGIKVADFAISPRARKDGGPLPAGWTHPYLSPEHVSAPEKIGPRSDQYSLAATAYRMYTGRPPFFGSGAELGSAISTQAFVPPSSVRSTIPPAADAVFAKALAKDPLRRYNTNGEFMDALEASLLPAAIPVPVAARAKPAPWMYFVLGALALLLAALFLMKSRNPQPAKSTERALAAAPAAPIMAEPPAPAKRKPVKLTANVAANTAPSGRVPRAKVASAATSGGDSEVLPQRPVLPPKERNGTADFVPMSADNLEIAVYSREHKLTPGINFGYRDPTLGELAYGDLKVRVDAAGSMPKGRLTLEWVVDEIRTELKPVVPNRLIEYGNEPTAGIYRITLWLDGKRQLKTFSFRITP